MPFKVETKRNKVNFGDAEKKEYESLLSESYKSKDWGDKAQICNSLLL